MKSNPPRKHHYVPQFYLKQFSSDETRTKVPTLSNNQLHVIKGHSAIKKIAYEDYLYAIKDKELNICIENELNYAIEAPITQSETWKRIRCADPDLLTKTDMLLIYIFARHLNARNIESLEFIRKEAHSVQSPDFAPNYTPEEIEMHRKIRKSPTEAQELFLYMSRDINRFMKDFATTRVSILSSDIHFRTSTNPVVYVPIGCFEGNAKLFGLTNLWIPLCQSFGALIMLRHKKPGFESNVKIDDVFAKYLNRIYISQLLEVKSLRYCIASDQYIEDDLNWANYFTSGSNNKKFSKRI